VIGHVLEIQEFVLRASPPTNILCTFQKFWIRCLAPNADLDMFQKFWNMRFATNRNSVYIPETLESVFGATQ
jgi:hypothetical protein